MSAEHKASVLKPILSGLVLLTVLGGIALGIQRRGDGGEKALPKIVAGGPSLDGTEVAVGVRGPSLTDDSTIELADYKGKKVIINLWASWCGPCKDEAPDIKKFTEDRTDVVMLGVNVDTVKSAGQKFNRDVGWTHPSIHDDLGKVGYDALKVESLPVTLFIDETGVIRGRSLGQIDYDDLVEVADRL